MSAASSSSNKKAKKETSFETLRRYILDCPHLPRDSPAIKAALSGLDQELKRRERDAKLQQKFSAGKSISKGKDSTEQEEEELMNEWEDVPRVEESKGENINSNEERQKNNSSKHKSPDDSNDDDADTEEVEIIDVSGVTSVLGKRLASISINSIAQYQQKVKSPLAAIAIALHAALRSDVLGFVCTGIPDDPKKTGGFAKPVRALPKSEFLPKNWDQNAAADKASCEVVLRYKKNGMGSILLKVQQEDQSQEGGQSLPSIVSVKVMIVPTTSQEPPNEFMMFPINQHINLDSWNAALANNSSSHDSLQAPALHYKGLSVLLTNFTKTFDLGHINDAGDDSNTNQNGGNNTAHHDSSQQQLPIHPPGHHIPPEVNDPAFSQPYRPVVVNDPWRNNNPGHPPMPPSITAPGFHPGFPGNNPPSSVPGGDFASDLLPGGLNVNNPLLRNGPAMGGNVMGPNHPFFTGAGVSGIVGPAPPGGMQPRFDPFGPPGGPTEINPPNFPGRGNILGGRIKRDPPPRPGGSGEPDNDLMRPPDNNMFM